MKEFCSAERDDIVGNKVAPLTILPGGFGGRRDLSAFDRERGIRGMLSLSASTCGAVREKKSIGCRVLFHVELSCQHISILLALKCY